MNSRWKEITLGEFVRLQRGHDLTISERKPGTVPVIGSAGTNGTHDTALCRGPGLTIGRSGVGSMGVVTYVPTDYWPHNTVLYVTDFLGNDPRFAYYFLSHFDLRRYNSGSAQASLNRNYIYPVQIRVPEPPEQKAIAAVLGALDDKIELNRRMNATLEAMAQALFQSWFVDFDPVRAKLDGRKPTGLDKVTATLFSDSFQDSKLGHIPNGWAAGNFGDVIAAQRERVGNSEAIVLSAVASSELVRSDEHFNKQVYSKSINNYLKVRLWDFAYNPSRINIGSVGMLKQNFTGAVSPVYEVFRPRAGYHWFAERALAQRETKAWIQTLCSGSVRQSLKLRDLASIPLVIPPPGIVQAFNRAWESWYALIEAKANESRILATLRDTLLPKLLSGELEPTPLN